MQIAIVTGANRGIGFEVAKQLAQQSATKVILSARSLAKAHTAAKTLADSGLDVVAKELDVASDDSVQRFADELAGEYDHVDVLVNNAAAFADWSETASSADLAVAHQVMETNLFGVWRTTRALLPLIGNSKHGRIVNVGSGGGTHGDPQFGLAGNNGAAASYGVSKAALHALTVKFAAELTDSGILVNAVDPGLTATAPGMEAMGARPVADGAASIVWAALLPDDGPSGGLFRDGEPIAW